MKNNDNEQYLISDGKLHVEGLSYKQLKMYIDRFALSESGDGLDYCASIQELQTDEDYLVTFHGRMPLESLNDLVWELHKCDNAQRTITAYTNCNCYGLPANAMLCMNEKIDDAEPIAVDNQGHVYIYDYESKSLNYKLTDKTTRYKSCPRTKTVEKDIITVTAEDDADEPAWCGLLQLAFWIAFFALLIMGPSKWMELPKLLYFLDDFLFDSVPGGIIVFSFLMLGFFMHGKGYIKIGPFTILALIGFPFVLSIFANYYITPEQHERVAIITDKDIADDSNWIEWKYTDDNSSFGVNDNDIHDQLQVGDTCIVDWRHGVMGWPVVRGIVKK